MRQFIYILLSFLLFACDEPSSALRSGDLVFQGSGSSVLSSAIDEVTQTRDSTHYSHMGVLECIGSDCYVWHSSPADGVRRQSLKEFVANSNDRIVHFFRPQIVLDTTSIMRRLRSFEGQPYNFTYVFEDEGVYCSELVYEAFADEGLFELNEMTFKSPHSDTFSAGWVAYYDSLGRPIPEGELGCNPNGMAANDQLMFLGGVEILSL